MYGTSGKRVRFGRLMNPASNATFLVPLDHSVADGPVASTRQLVSIVGAVASHGGDGVVLHKGRARFLPPELFRDLSLVIHLSGSTAHAADTDAKVLLCDVEEALHLGADAVSVHVNLGSDTETRQLTDLGRVAAQCDRWGVPLLAMIYPRGPRITSPADEDLVAHAASLAADLGADLVKTPYTGSVASMARVVESCPIPVLTAGGSSLGDDAKLAGMVRDVMASGVRGVAMGRNVFQSDDVAATVRAVAGAVHGERRAPLAAA
ncbi:class I fructose-bisphosphate aldolase family protein [Streptomyces abikoensis]